MNWKGVGEWAIQESCRALMRGAGPIELLRIANIYQFSKMMLVNGLQG